MPSARSPLIAAGAGAVAVATLFVDWFAFTVANSWAAFVPTQQPSPSGSGWQTAGWAVSLGVVAMLLAALAWCAMARLGRSPTTVRETAWATTVASLAASGLILARMLDRPDLGIGAASNNVAPQPGIFVALTACLVVCAASVSGAGISFRRFRQVGRVTARLR